MRRFLPLIFFLLSGFFLVAADNPPLKKPVAEPVFSLMPTVGGYSFAGSEGIKPAPVVGVKLGYDLYISNIADSISIEGTASYLNSSLDSGGKVSGYLLRLDAAYPLFLGKKWVPLAAIGMGAINLDAGPNKGFSPLLNYGFGLKYLYSDDFIFRGDVRQLFPYRDVNTRNNFELAFGVQYFFGKKKAQEKPQQDSDGDGVPDTLDRCPDTPKGMSVDKNGCPPDSDGDGVPDYLDKCPGTLPGIPVDSEGCPDLAKIGTLKGPETKIVLLEGALDVSTPDGKFQTGMTPGKTIVIRKYSPPSGPVTASAEELRAARNAGSVMYDSTKVILLDGALDVSSPDGTASGATVALAPGMKTVVRKGGVPTGPVAATAAELVDARLGDYIPPDVTTVIGVENTVDVSRPDGRDTVSLPPENVTVVRAGEAPTRPVPASASQMSRARKAATVPESEKFTKVIGIEGKIEVGTPEGKGTVTVTPGTLVLVREKEKPTRPVKAPEAEMKEAREAASVAPLRKVIGELTVLFPVNVSTVAPRYFADIKRLAALMKRSPGATASVEGHTDSTGNDPLNDKLSNKRAESVRAALIRYGADPGAISAMGYGRALPVADNATAEGRRKNRRAVTSVTIAVTAPRPGAPEPAPAPAAVPSPAEERADLKKSTRIVALEGTVEVTAGGKTSTLEPGMSLVVGAGGAMKPVPASAEELRKGNAAGTVEPSLRRRDAAAPPKVTARQLRVEFRQGSSIVGARYTSSLKEIAAILKGTPGSSVTIEGESDRGGSPKAKQRLSRDRAESVQYVLVHYCGADPRRITISGVGLSGARATVSVRLPGSGPASGATGN